MLRSIDDGGHGACEGNCGQCPLNGKHKPMDFRHSVNDVHFGIHLGTLTGLPDTSQAPRGSHADIAAGLKAAGYTAVQGAEDPAYRAAGLTTYGSGRVLERHEVRDHLARQRDAGHAATTLHVGTGFESDGQAMGLIEAILAAAEALHHPTHIETHRATITQDIWRTLRWVEYFPELTFNADLSHWYTGLEMPYGDFADKLDRLAPVFARTRFVHGRIGNGGSIQITLGIGGQDEPHVSRFQQMWQRCFEGFLRHGQGSAPIVFAVELLPAWVQTDSGAHYIDYAPLERDSSGVFVEQADRWAQAKVLVEIARRAATAAVGQTKTRSPSASA